MQEDIRWVQRLDNFSRALSRLEGAVKIVSSRIKFGEDVDELLEEGMIQRFEYTHELAWNTMKDYEEYQGYTDIRGSRDAIRKALEIGLVDDRRWMESIADRNRSSHNYDELVVSGILVNIIEVYFPLFKAFEANMKNIYEEDAS
jgi:nucleotidyltransferase substrate-binding family protein